jgi:C4-dicarboxylate transporter
MCLRITLIIPAASVSTIVSETDIVTAVASVVVTASAEQIPRICSVTGFCRINGSVNVVQKEVRDVIG